MPSGSGRRSCLQRVAVIRYVPAPRIGIQVNRVCHGTRIYMTALITALARIVIGFFGCFRVDRFAHRIGAVEPPAEVDQLAPFTAKRSKRSIVLSVDSDGLAAGWTLINWHGTRSGERKANPEKSNQSVFSADDFFSVFEGAESFFLPSPLLAAFPLLSPFLSPVDDSFSALAAFL